MNLCHWVGCSKPAAFGTFSIVDNHSARHDFCSAWHRTLFTWLDMPQPERLKPFVNDETVSDMIASLKTAAPH